MDLHYYKYTFEEDNTHKTWYYGIVDYFVRGSIVGSSENGWTKRKMPDNLNDDEQLDWYIISNREDIHFVNMESQACTQWQSKHIDEIIKAQKYNNKIKLKNHV